MSNYIVPETVEDTLALMAEGTWRPLAGGTDFYPQLGDRPVDFNVMDISGLGELGGNFVL